MKRVVITGMGAISPVGNDIPTFWNNLKNGVCGIDTIRSFSTDDLPVKIAAEVKDFKPDSYGIDAATARKNDRYALFALAASNQAMKDSGLQIEPERLGVYIGSGIGGMNTFIAETTKMIQKGPQWISPLFVPMMISNIASGNVAIEHNAQGVCLPIVTACATGTHSIGEAFKAIKHGYADAIITGGAEAAVVPLAIGGFANSRALSRSEDPMQASLPFDKRRQGFVIAEGAGILVLEEYEHARARGAKMYAEVCGYGNTCDAYHYTAPRPDGSSAARAIQLALTEAGFKAGELLHINSHGTGTPLNDKSETAAIKLALGEKAAYKAIINSTKSMTGHMLGAAGGIELIATALALKEGIIPPTVHLDEPDPECDLDYTPNQARKADISIAVSTSLGFGGHNGCIALRKI
ncbi:MAG TPA: beta-ketoacyl-ACP synthase II [Bacteroidales bacterium]|nr:beta-ketoacyl-ACP synthase II [Bacteroidales bacterium]OQC02828.1 MAG: 3-oxoacyl-(acyl-carrier-protein) synthase 2 [Bacteroidetes bacterium ADurb.Bin090]HNZ80452.1 beta-ketoacyl-ACP synthase II [Bacteroidales bacterium]HOD26900.1 beta-ketoacyl-ACP synthase II [Bacteroidales bacterium]HPH57491.1 beta-ketoacyl-ACP synthase II [Bacteroidales bacterium]